MGHLEFVRIPGTAAVPAALVKKWPPGKFRTQLCGFWTQVLAEWAASSEEFREGSKNSVKELLGEELGKVTKATKEQESDTPLPRVLR